MLPVIVVCAGVFILIITGTVGGIFAFKKLPGLYKNGGSYDGDSLHPYHTLAHEMFHFIQMEYTTPMLSAVWFDEASPFIQYHYMITLRR